MYCLIDVAKTYQDLNLGERSLEVFEQALRAVENCECDSARATNFGDIGYQYVKLGRTSKGFELLETALKLATNLEDVNSRDLTLCDVLRNYGDLGQIDIALEIARLLHDKHRIISRILEPLKIDPSEFFDRHKPKAPHLYT
ncbi:hypothetical protein H6F89_03810 [Cyanobacteria bacterium FACHB-63]|nr:hypothetical protein [Cyanobacteria bacterium FACHB-63]